MCICGCDNCDINAQLGSEPHLKLFTSENVKHPLQIANRDPLIFYRSCWSDIDNGPTNSPWVVLIIAAAAFLLFAAAPSFAVISELALVMAGSIHCH